MQSIRALNKVLLISLMLILSSCSKTTAQSTKGLYVDDFFYILGDEIAEDKLLDYANSNDFNYLILYNTAKIHRNKYPLDQKKGSETWQNFIVKAKAKYGIEKIGVVGEKAASFIPVIKYNQQFCNSPTEKIDVLNLEFEFWNKRLYNKSGYYCTTYLMKQGYACSNEGAFNFYIDQLKKMRALASETEFEIETYVGNPTDDQIIEIGKYCNSILVHYYRNKIEGIANYKINRLIALQNSNPKLKVIPIFSSRENHLGPWLKKHKIEEVAPFFYQQLKSSDDININDLNIDGEIWYRYTNMPKKR